MTELETMMRAKQYIESLANGKNPLTGQNVKDDDIINNVRISRCLFYVSGVLQKVIDNGGVVCSQESKKAKFQDFNLTDEQKTNLKPTQSPLSATKVVAIINSEVNEGIMKKLKVTAFTQWLISIGLLEEIVDDLGKKRKRPTSDGEMLGILEKEYSDNISSHLYTVYNSNAQQFVFDNIDSVIEFAAVFETEKLSQKRAETENQGKPWEENDDQKLIELYNQNVSLKDLCKIFKRSRGGVQARLVKLGIINK